MANQHAHQGRNIRQIPKDEWDDFGALCEAAGTNRSAAIGEYIRWALRRPDSPKRLARPAPKPPAPE